MSVVSRSSRRAVLTGLAGTVAGCAATPPVPLAAGFAPRRIAPILGVTHIDLMLKAGYLTAAELDEYRGKAAR